MHYVCNNPFKEGRENVNDDARPGRPSTSTTVENIEAVKKIILDNRWITVREVADDVDVSCGSRQAIFCVYFWHKHAAAKIVPNSLNFEQKQRHMDIAQKMLTTFNNHIFVPKGHNWRRIMAIWLRHWNLALSSQNGSLQKSQDWRKHVEFGQMWGFCTVFPSIAMAWCITKSCHKDERAIRNTILKFCAACAKQFNRNARNYGKTNHGRLAYISMVVLEIFSEKYNRNQDSTAIFTLTSSSIQNW